jgi:adenylate kinase family enzyme
MAPKTFIFIGRSGCGKGTQAKLLREQLEAKDPHKQKIIYLETGPRFRDFIKGNGYSNELAAKIAESGERQPDFLAVWNWSHVLIEDLTGKEHLIIDGMPRSYEEALIFNTAMTFYQRLKPVVIYIDVSRGWSRKRLLARAGIEKREDDIADVIEKRLAWFERDVMPAVDFFDRHPGYQFIHVNGEQPIEKVAKDIMSRLSW